ncbi:MAG: OpgC domain-containing protein [Beijerinckiaceae bacterium]|nr:OpgC domain-containing protein [Beijerinckiaceae bacterium]
MHGVVTPAPQARSARDVRLDFFRGLAMFIIFIAHVPSNSWVMFIPAQFGFSSGAEMFVFCSGVASGLAFGSVFVKRGFLLGLVRVAYRVWQVYWAHIGLCLVIGCVYFLAATSTGDDYTSMIGLSWLQRDPEHALVALMTLRYTPAYLDILPMYVVLLASIPLVMLLSGVHRFVFFAASIGCWLAVQFTNFNIPSGEGGEGVWFFNPFAWQLLFFTGFSFSMGWLKRPTFRTGPLFYLCLAAVLISIPVNFWAFRHVYESQPDLKLWLVQGDVFAGTTNEHILRYLHFLALAYVVLTLVEPRRHWLDHRLARPIILVGQQSLATFLGSLALALASGIVLDQLGRSLLTTALTNAFGFLAILAIAVIARFFKSQPWKTPKTADQRVSITKT